MQLAEAVERWQSATGKRKAAAWHSAIAVAMDVMRERDDLNNKLEKQWGWLWHNEQHEQFVEREQKFLALLGEYESRCRQLSSATILLGDDALLPSSRSADDLPLKRQPVTA